jgi:hypothetical protein
MTSFSSLGFKNTNFTNTLEDNCIFIGSCKINVNCTGSLRTTGKTVINGDPKNSPHEAECSAAANFLESVLGIKVLLCPS